MDRLKTFSKYVLIIIAFYFFSNLLIFMALKCSYEPITGYDAIATQDVKIEVGDAKATFVNGYVEGKIKNKSAQVIQDKYIQIDFYSKRNVNLGTKYVKIESLKPESEKEFRMAFKLQDVDHYEMSYTDVAKVEGEEPFISQEMGITLILGTVFFLYFFG